MNKNELRKKCREKINGTSPEKFKEWGEKIFFTVSRTEEWKKAKTVFVFVSLKREADTMPLLIDLLQGGKTLCVPKITGDGTMDAVIINSLSDLQNGKFGIPEPAESCPSIEKSEIDLAIIPCVAADECGNRLGKGGGFYDRFCENTDFKKFVVCPELFVIKGEKIPAEKHDVSADKVITEKRVISIDIFSDI